MTATLDQICTGFETTLSTIGGLSVYDHSAGSVVFPALLVIPPAINYRETFGVGVVTLTFDLTLFTGASWHENQKLLRQYLDWDGDNSVRRVIDANPSLGLSGVDAHVMSSRPLGLEEIAGYDAFGASLSSIVAVTKTP